MRASGFGGGFRPRRWIQTLWVASLMPFTLQGVKVWNGIVDQPFLLRLVERGYGRGQFSSWRLKVSGVAELAGPKLRIEIVEFWNTSH
jgi:hypothetical protein